MLRHRVGRRIQHPDILTKPAKPFELTLLVNPPSQNQRLFRVSLDSGAPARPDPKRPDFFEIEDDTHVFYVHVFKAGGKVTLLAVWDRAAESAA